MCLIFQLETLSREDQNILRTASIIGRKFTLETLYGVLPPKMRTQMFCSINSMVENHWIAESVSSSSPSTPSSSSSFSSSSRSSCPYPIQSSPSPPTSTSTSTLSHLGQIEVATMEYSFVHPLFYQTLYELTPASDKARLHYSVAKFLEESYGDNPIYYARLGFHYGVAKDCRSKALEYYSKAANYSLSDNILSFDQSLTFLNKAKNYADTAMDYGSILGILTAGVEELYLKKKILLECKELSSSAKTFLSWDTFRSQTSLLRLRKNRINIAPTIRKNHSLKKSHDFTIENINILLDLFYDMEDKINLSYDGMVLLNCVGIIYSWQMLYLKKWKTFSFHDSQSPKLESFLTKNSTRSLSLSQGKIK